MSDPRFIYVMKGLKKIVPPKREILKGIWLSFFPGAKIGVVGPNGSGKTTLFNSIVGTHAVDAGSIVFMGQEISNLSVQKIARRGLLRTFQQTHIYGQMNCVQNICISIPHRREGLRTLFAAIPYNIVIPDQEAWYHTVIYLVLSLMSVKIAAEIQTNTK